jgi:L-lactate dehydrogenase (cytochrome)
MLKLNDVRNHTSLDSCWIIIEGEVYDVTDFIEHHPGGAAVILQFAGKVDRF